MCGKSPEPQSLNDYIVLCLKTVVRINCFIYMICSEWYLTASSKCILYLGSSDKTNNNN